MFGLKDLLVSDLVRPVGFAPATGSRSAVIAGEAIHPKFPNAFCFPQIPAFRDIVAEYLPVTGQFLIVFSYVKLAKSANRLIAFLIYNLVHSKASEYYELFNR